MSLKSLYNFGGQTPLERVCMSHSGWCAGTTRASGQVPPERVGRYTSLGVRCTLRSGCGSTPCSGCGSTPCSGYGVHSARGVVYPPLGVQCTLRSGYGVPSARGAVYPPLGVRCTLRSVRHPRSFLIKFSDKENLKRRVNQIASVKSN